MNKRGETRTPCILKHCGAITGALNIPARHDAAHGSLDCRGSRCEAPFVPLCLSSRYSQARRRPPEVAGWETACWTPARFHRESTAASGCIQTKAGALVETQVFSFIIMRPCHFGCSGLCGCMEGGKKTKKSWNQLHYFAETLQLSGEGDLLAIWHRGTGEWLVCHSSISKVAEERLFAAVRNFREMYDYLCTTWCHTMGPVSLSDDHQSSKTCTSLVSSQCPRPNAPMKIWILFYPFHQTTLRCFAVSWDLVFWKTQDWSVLKKMKIDEQEGKKVKVY